MPLGIASALGADAASQRLRQMMLDRLMERVQTHQMGVEDRRMNLAETEGQQRTDILRQAQQDRTRALDDRENARQDTAAVTAFTMNPAGAPLAPNLAIRGRMLGLPIPSEPGVAGPMASAGLPTDMGGGGSSALTPESTPTTYMRGQTQADIDKQTALTSAQDARQAALDAAAQGRQELIAGRADQAAQQRQMQLQIAGMSNDTRRAVADVTANAGREKAAEKQAAAEKETQGKRQAALRVTDDSLDALSEVLDVGPPDPVTGKETYALKPGVGQLYGARVPGLSLIPGTDTANAAAAMNRLRGRLVTDLLGELKSQSRTGATGFGALSEKELAILQQSASKLENSGMSDSDVLNELVRIRERLMRAKQEPGAGSPQDVRPNGPQPQTAAPPKRLRYDLNGKPLP